MPRPSRIAWALLSVLVVACSAVTDFDRDKLPATIHGLDGGPHSEMDAQGTQSGDLDEASVDGGGAIEGDCRRHSDCARDRLCCGGTCVATTEGRCSDCEAACTLTEANVCTDRVCSCGAGAACGAGQYCVVTGRNAACAECRDANDCEGRSDGRTQCIQGQCAACDPKNNGGCSGNTPICNATSFVCEACNAAPDNCPGNPVCTPSGACGGCTTNDAADCTNPTSPICNLSLNPTMCRGCMSDTECMTELSRPYCINNQRCSICNPTNDAGCVASSGTPDCRLNGGTYQCQACTASSCATGQHCDNASGKCVQCRDDNDCDSNSALPYCDTATGTCRACSSSTTLGGNAWCLLNSLGTRPVCHTSGRCVRCDGNVGCSGNTSRCYMPDANAPQSNVCAACRPNVAGDCTGATPVCNAQTRVCRACATATQATDCPTTAAPVCNTSTGACVACLVGMRGAAAGCSSAGQPLCVMGAAGPQCVQCNAPSDCPPATPICNVTTHQCSACTVGNAADNMQCAMRTTGTVCVTGGTCARCDTTTNSPCVGQLCCPDASSDGPSCVARNAMHCASCTNACSGTVPVCLPTNVCGCVNNGDCPGSQMCAAGICVPMTGGTGSPTTTGAAP